MTDSGEDSRAAEGPIVLYDGVCGLCDRSVQLILRNDRRGRFRFAALQSETGRALLEKFDLPPEALDSVVLVEGGRAWRKSRAALHVARRMDAPWPLLWPLTIVPARWRTSSTTWWRRTATASSESWTPA